MQHRRTSNTRPMAWVAIIGLGFLTLAFGGSYFVSRQINKAADEHASSAGRSGDKKPNLMQEQHGESAQGATTSGSRPSSVPPASR